MKMLKRQLIGLALIACSSYSFGGECATGYVTDVYVGGWNQEGLHIKLEYTDGTSPPTVWPAGANAASGLMQFKQSLGADRINALRAVAMLALANGNKVIVKSNVNNSAGQLDCTSASEIQLRRVTASS